MYIPKHFAVEDVGWAHRLIQDYSFGTLVTVLDGSPFATHLPFVLDPEPEPNGTLLAHMARANPQWRGFSAVSDAPEVLAIFQGPHAYVSPSWYEGDAPAVPTWNYAVVHAYGTPRIVDDERQIRDFLRRLTTRQEARFERPWSPEILSEEYLSHMTHQIVAFEIPIARLEAKAKLSQNRPPVDRVRVANELEKDPDAGSRAVSALMKDKIVPVA